MLSKFYLIGDDMFYFGGSDDGSMKTGSQSIKDNTGDTYKFYFYTKAQYGHEKGAGVIGNQSNKLYYYGMQIQADDYKYQIATIEIGKDANKKSYSFIVNSNGTIQHSSNTEYKEDGDVLIKTKDAQFVKDGQFKYSIVGGVDGTKVQKGDVSDVVISDFIDLN